MPLKFRSKNPSNPHEYWIFPFFYRQTQEKIFFHGTKIFVYSRDGLGSRKHSTKAWEKTSRFKFHCGDFEALKCHVTEAEPMRLQDCLHDTEADLAQEIMEDLAGLTDGQPDDDVLQDTHSNSNNGP
jgi:hypothetical protein